MQTEATVYIPWRLDGCEGIGAMGVPGGFEGIGAVGVSEGFEGIACRGCC